MTALALRPLPAQNSADPFDTHIRAAQAAARGGLPVIAEREYRAALLLHPADADAMYALGGIQEQMGQKGEAVTRYREVIRLRPDFAPAHNALAGLLEDAGQTAAALAQYRQALVLEPQDARLHFNLAAALEDAGQHRESQEEYRAALRLQPDFAEAKAALREIPSLPAPSAAPPVRTNHVAQIKQGEILLRQGRVTEAIAAFRTALAAYLHDAAAHLHLGIALYTDGQTASARREWQIVLGLGDLSAATQARRLLAAYR